MDALTSALGLLAVVLYVFVKDVLPWVRQRGGNGKSGDKTSDYWESRIREIIHEELEETRGEVRRVLEYTMRLWDRTSGRS